MYKLLLRVMPLALLVCLAVSAAETSPHSAAELEKGVRDMMLLSAQTRLIYRDENGAVLTLEQFNQLVQGGKGFSVAKDDAAGTATLTLKSKPARDVDANAVKQLPPLDVRDLHGRRIRNLDLAGRPTLINFYFETCAPCIKEVPILNAYRRRHQEFNYLAVTPDDAESAKRFVKERGFDWPVAYDGKPFIEAMLVKGYPTYFLVASDGRILGRASGMDMRDLEDPAKALGKFEKWVSTHLSRRD